MKTKIVKTICLVVVFIVISSCKKEKREPEPEQQPPVSNTPQPEPLPSRIDGEVTYYLYFSFKSDSARFQHGQVHASFYSISHHIDSLPKYSASDDVGSITFNGQEMQKLNNTTGLIYHYSPSTLNESAELMKTRSWNIAGSGSFKEIKFVDKATIPQYLSNTTLIDTIYKYKTNTIKIGTLVGVDSATIGIREIDASGFSEYRIFDKTKKELVFSKENFYSMNPFNQFTFVEVEIIFVKQSFQVVDGKAFRYNFYLTYVSEKIPFKSYE